MKIQTPNGPIEAKVIKYVTINGRKLGVHKYCLYDGSFDSKHFSITDYQTGMKIPSCDYPTVKRVIAKAQEIMSSDRAKGYDYSKHEVINK